MRPYVLERRSRPQAVAVRVQAVVGRAACARRARAGHHHGAPFDTADGRRRVVFAALRPRRRRSGRNDDWASLQLRSRQFQLRSGVVGKPQHVALERERALDRAADVDGGDATPEIEFGRYWLASDAVRAAQCIGWASAERPLSTSVRRSSCGAVDAWATEKPQTATNARLVARRRTTAFERGTRIRGRGRRDFWCARHDCTGAVDNPRTCSRATAPSG